MRYVASSEEACTHSIQANELVDHEQQIEQLVEAFIIDAEVI